MSNSSARANVTSMAETELIEKRYEKRKSLSPDLYNALNPDVYLRFQEFERTLIRLIHATHLAPLNNKRLLEIGCGTGAFLLHLIRLGFKPENLLANELLDERVMKAKNNLPSSIKVIEGNALDLDLPLNSFDIVYQSTVFSSILDLSFQEQLAAKMWDLAKPGGGILWYDFVYNNPRNPDVVGISIKRIKKLFPEGDVKHWRTTLAPPLSRVAVKFHPCMYALLNCFPFLRTHVLCWIEKKQ